MPATARLATPTTSVNARRLIIIRTSKPTTFTSNDAVFGSDPTRLA